MTFDYTHTILLVDDEPGIIRSLKRLFRKEGHKIKTADSGTAALELIRNIEDPISLMISDQRMPGMSGAQFLEKAKQRFPDAIRILLTGYSDMDAIVAAVNEGEIHRYLTKPWQDDDLLLHVRQAIKQYELTLENRRLTALTEQQNKELQAMNQNLETEVVKRTRGIIKQHEMLQNANQALEKSLLDVVRLVASLVNSLNPTLGKFMADTAKLATDLAGKMQLSAQQIKQIEMAAIIHEIGLLGANEKLLVKDENLMGKREKEKYHQHPVVGSQLLENMQGLDEAARIIKHHHERYDGRGFPDGLKGEAIPMEARILAVASGYQKIVDFSPDTIAELKDYGRRLLGAHAIKEMEISEPGQMARDIARQYVKSASHIHYDPAVVRHFLDVIGYVDPEAGQQWVDVNNLISGMTLTSDLRFSDGRLLLTKGTCLDDGIIATILSINARSEIPDKIKVRVQEV